MYYKNNNIVSVFPPVERVWNIISPSSFEEQRNKLLIHEKSAEKSFFTHMLKLIWVTTLPSVRHYFDCPNSEFSDTNSKSQNLYLTRCSTKCSNVLNSLVIKDTENIFHCVKVQGWEGSIYCSTSVDNGFNIFYSRCIDNCSNIWFCTSLISCQECLFCSELENKSYCIWNKQYEKEDYFEEKKRLLSQKQNFYPWFLELNGDPFKNISSENIEKCIWATSVKNARNGIILWNPIGTENMYDVVMSWTTADYYGVSDSWALSQQIYCSCSIVNSSSIFYSFFLESCSFCLWCIGLKNQTFCILNKQYSKQEWYKEVDKIFTQMEQENILWEFFPGSMNPFYFNDTLASILWDFDKKEVEGKWYLWRGESVKVDIPKNSKILDIQSLENYQWYNSKWEWEIDSRILKSVIQDEWEDYYKITQMEYDFLVKNELPLPENHWLKMMKNNFN